MKIKNSLSVKVFLWIAGSLILCSFLIYGSILFCLPKSYVAVSSQSINAEIEELTDTLSKTKFENSKDVLETFCLDNQATIVFHATIPSNIPLYFITLALFVIVSLTISCVLGLAVKNQAKLTMYSQVVFLPSIMLSGIMFSAELLPNFLESMGKLFPATWGYTLLIQKNIEVSTFIPLVFILIISVFVSVQLLKKIRSE